MPPLGFRCFGRLIGVSWQRGGASDDGSQSRPIDVRGMVSTAKRYLTQSGLGGAG
jgi:hypothetical protein